MLFKLAKTETHELQVLPKRSVQDVVRIDLNNDTPDKAEIRRQMYERMARGNALADVEETANRKWQRH